MCRRCRDIYYSYECSSCQDCFGCVGLKNKQYCIFNTQYTKETYEQEVLIIIAHMEKTKEWGEFFPTAISPFSYNESVVQEYFPLTKEQALSRGYKWYERSDRNYSTSLVPSEIPKTIDSIDDSILNEIIKCETQFSETERIRYTNCTTAFKITSD